MKNSDTVLNIQPVFPVKSTVSVRLNEVKSARNLLKRDIKFPDPEMTERDFISNNGFHSNNFI